MAAAHEPRAVAPHAPVAALLVAARAAPAASAHAPPRRGAVAVSTAVVGAERLLAALAAVALLANAHAITAAISMMIAIVDAAHDRAVGTLIALGAETRPAGDAAMPMATAVMWAGNIGHVARWPSPAVVARAHATAAAPVLGAPTHARRDGAVAARPCCLAGAHVSEALSVVGALGISGAGATRDEGHGRGSCGVQEEKDEK